MKRFLDTLRNIWAIEELRQRILMTLALILVYRLGSYVVLPGIDIAALDSARENAGDSGGLVGLINMFAGGAFLRASVFGLGIMPYITASIIIQLLGMAVPYFQKLQRDGESGRKKINQFTRLLTIGVTAVQAPGYIASIKQTAPNAFADTSTMWWVQTILILVTGTMFVMWLGERITDKGLGNGISLIIMIGIISRLPFAFLSEVKSRTSGNGGLIIFLIEIVLLLMVIVGCILLVQGTRRIPVQFAKKIVGNKQYGGVRQYIPLKVNAAGVMPIIFAQAIMFIPAAVAGFSSSTGGIFQDRYGFWYNLIFAVLIILFTYFYTAIMVNPKNLADDMKRNGGFIPGVKPGNKTAEFIDAVMNRITLPGSLFLAGVAIMPSFAEKLGVNSAFADFYGGTSLLILVGVVLDTLQQIETYLLNRHYDGLMKSGRIKGRGANAMMVQQG
ncbi:MAG: preprotein translocase subunit SecY [Bacteroidia bacterium]|nr:preprotein translocase subunit SecY [Sphingobacteriaceae bacterium]MBK7311518.1 preprotein translocase subunit SecY [Sphingobacteriaceae bacterium]MBP9069388.1 preprotein translocase subunit SecY [Bacteroidia bacterium]